ncbi:MAG: helix-turn-helix transcriptional regulator [Anaerolineales bacterium]|nr:helix-turn-helix transcriptional regulator [Anaerolineales bacterium]
MIGEKINARRNELGLSLRALAKEVDLTASFLSQIERDQADPSIKSLRRIADALGVPMLHFLSEDEVANPVVRRGRRKRLMIPESGVTYELLTPDLDRKMEMFVAEVHPSDQNIAYPLPYATEECILVLEGGLRITLGDNEYDLKAGDSIYFDCSILNNLIATGDEPAVFVSAITPAVF